MTSSVAQPVTILVAEDDPEDQMLMQEAFAESRLMNPLHFVDDGAELLEYLETRPAPGVILLDLNMPKMDGSKVLETLKSDDRYCSIPVIVLTTSRAEEDVVKTYKLGVNSFITKPVTFSGLLEVVEGLGRYWVEIVSLPSDEPKAAAGR